MRNYSSFSESVSEPVPRAAILFFISIRILYHLYIKVYKSGSPVRTVPYFNRTLIKLKGQNSQKRLDRN